MLRLHSQNRIDRYIVYRTMYNNMSTNLIKNKQSQRILENRENVESVRSSRQVLRKWLPTFSCRCVSLMEHQWDIVTIIRLCRNIRFTHRTRIFVYLHVHDRILYTHACIQHTLVWKVSVTCTHVYALSGAPSGYPWLARANHHNGYDHLHSFL